MSQGLFDGKWHQLKLLVRPPRLSGFLDDGLIGQLSLDPVDPIYINGKVQLSKRPGSDATVPVSMQSSAWSFAPPPLVSIDKKHTHRDMSDSFFSRWTFRNFVSIAILCRVTERRPVRFHQW